MESFHHWADFCGFSRSTFSLQYDDVNLDLRMKVYFLSFPSFATTQVLNLQLPLVLATLHGYLRFNKTENLKILQLNCLTFCFKHHQHDFCCLILFGCLISTWTHFNSFSSFFTYSLFSLKSLFFCSASSLSFHLHRDLIWKFFTFFLLLLFHSRCHRFYSLDFSCLVAVTLCRWKSKENETENSWNSFLLDILKISYMSS